MPAVKVVTCSAACVPQETASELEITIIPFTLIVDGTEYIDGVDITVEDFYSMLSGGAKEVSTATPAIGDYLQAFSRLEDKCDAIFCVTLASRFSAEGLAASSAAEKCESVPVEVFDSGTAATAQGQVAIAAARAAAGGRGLEEVRSAAVEVAARVQLVATVDTLVFLRRSGRLGPVAAIAGDTMNIKPVFKLSGGEIEPLSKALSKKRALDRMVREAQSAASELGPLHLAFFHAAAREEAEALENRTLQRVPNVESFISGFTPVMGKHTGPGLVGLSFY